LVFSLLDDGHGEAGLEALIGRGDVDGPEVGVSPGAIAPDEEVPVRQAVGDVLVNGERGGDGERRREGDLVLADPGQGPHADPPACATGATLEGEEGQGDVGREDTAPGSGGEGAFENGDFVVDGEEGVGAAGDGDIAGVNPRGNEVSERVGCEREGE
jgi:hypothetical protein